VVTRSFRLADRVNDGIESLGAAAKNVDYV
jgi:hypothetical protein